MMNNRINKYQEFGRLRGKHWMAQIDEMVWALSNGSKKVPFKREDLTYLYDAEEIVKLRFFSATAEENRVDSLVREIDLAYPSLNSCAFTHIAMFVQTSTKNPLMMHEFNKLSEVVAMFNIDAPVLWGLGEDDSIGEEIFITIILSKEGEQ
jgi:cell division GTPase FtsZ